MAVRKEPSGRWRAELKIGRVHAGSRTFDTKREAEAWERQRKEALADLVDPKAGKIVTRERIEEWLIHRKATAAATTYKNESYMTKWIPRTILASPLDRVTTGMLVDSMKEMVEDGYAHKTVVRYRSMLGSFFNWVLERRILATSPLKGVKVPAGGRPPEEMNPWTRVELDERFQVWHELNPDMAEVARFLGLTGLRWSEARDLTPADVFWVPYPAVRVRHSRPEGVESKSTKNGDGRKVPLPNEVIPFFRQQLEGKAAGDLLFPPMHRGKFVHWLKWSETGQDRTIHDLRHTAICIWLAAGVKPGVVKTWSGHRTWTALQIYTHYLGTDADIEGLALLNRQSGRGPRGEGAGALPRDSDSG